MADLVVRGGTVVDTGAVADVLVQGDRIVAVGASIDAPRGATVLDAGGCWVGPGLVDLHAHLREPGYEEAETIETAARAAAVGGYTAVVAMPNTDPPVDCAAVVRQILETGRRACCDVAVAGAITVGRAGERLAPLGELAELGVRLFTDDGDGVQDGGLMRRALDYAKGLRLAGLPVVLAQHCEDRALVDGGVMHEGAWSSRLGLAGTPAVAEEAMVARDVGLVRLTGTPMHFLHLSTAGSVAIVARAKAEGLAVTAEAAPHHFCLTDEAVAGYDPTFKVNPPLRPPSDVAAVVAGLLDATIDAVATDHAPHLPEEKESPFDQAPPGMLGLETALALTVSELVPKGLSATAVFDLMSRRPAKIAGLSLEHGCPVAPGSPANLCVIDPSATWTVEAAALKSRARNTPYDGWTLTGRVRHTVLRGEPVVVDAEALR